MKGNVHAGEMALTLGDPAKAIAILEKVPANDPTAAYAAELLEAARSEATAIIKRWLDEIDKLTAKGRLNAAHQRCEQLLKAFPLTATQRGAVDERLARITRQMPKVRADLAQRESDARDYLLQNELDSAVRTLRERLPAAWDLEPQRALAWERIIAAAQWRLQQQASEGGDRIARMRSRRHIVHTHHASEAAPATPAPPSLTPEQQAVLTLLDQAGKAEKHGDSFTAIATYVEVLRRDPENTAAQQALQKLAKKRATLTHKLLARANQFFLRQNLQAALPYYQRVLQLDPDNERAKEGVRMYNNLQRIRRDAHNH